MTGPLCKAGAVFRVNFVALLSYIAVQAAVENYRQPSVRLPLWYS